MSETLKGSYVPSRVGVRTLFECQICGAYMPCKKVKIGHIETVVCINCLEQMQSVKEVV